MAYRTNATDVKRILDNTTLSTTIIETFINSANIMVTQVLGTSLDADVLCEIEMWLSAHMISITRERQALKEQAGTAAITYTGSFGSMLNSTTYGQMVIALDTTGAMAAQASGLKPAFMRAITSFDD